MQTWKAPVLLGLLSLGTLLAQSPALPVPTFPDQGPVQTPIGVTIESVPASAPMIESVPFEQFITHSGMAIDQTSFNLGSHGVVSNGFVTSVGCGTCNVAGPVFRGAISDGLELAAPPWTSNVVIAPSNGGFVNAGCRGCGRRTIHVRRANDCCNGTSGYAPGVVGGFDSYGYDSAAYSGTTGYYYAGSGSGSGVSSGVISPVAISGGLHTRYPYYNYRHPWFYQGPPSQNVTIVW